MPGKNKTPLLGWHPPAELSAWVREEATQRGVTVSAVLTEAVDAYRTKCYCGHTRGRHNMSGTMCGGDIGQMQCPCEGWDPRPNSSANTEKRQE